MVDVFKIDDDESVILNSGEILEDRPAYFRIHSATIHYSKKEYYFENRQLKEFPNKKTLTN